MSRIVVELGYDTDYAVPVHEILHVHHPVGQAKYLEVPLMQAVAGMDARLASDVERALRVQVGRVR